MSCKWCDSKQAFFDLPNGETECNRCYFLRKMIDETPDLVTRMICDLAVREKIKEKKEKWDSQKT